MCFIAAVHLIDEKGRVVQGEVEHVLMMIFGLCMNFVMSIFACKGQSSIPQKLYAQTNSPKKKKRKEDKSPEILWCRRRNRRTKKTKGKV